MKKTYTAIVLAIIMMFSLNAIVIHVAPTMAMPPVYGPSLKLDDTINKVNATLGIKGGSQVTAKGIITNIGLVPLAQLLTGVYFAEGSGVAIPADFSFDFSYDCETWFPIHPSEVKVADPFTGYQVELVIGPPGGEALAPGESKTMYLRMNVLNDLTPIKDTTGLGMLQSIAVAVFGDGNGDRHLNPGEPIYTQPPAYGGVIGWDNPVKLDLAIVHTAEIDGTGKFYYSIQNAINAASPGDTIWVYDGTYKETLYITKDLTIKAASTPVIKGSALFAMGSFGSREAVVFVNNSANVILENLDIEGEGLGPVKNYGVVYMNSGGGIYNCIVSPNTLGDMQSTGVAGFARSDFTVENCLIQNFGRIGVYATNVEKIVVNKNDIIGQSYSGVGEVNYGIEIEDYGGASVAEITRNKIHNCNNTHPAPSWSSGAIIADVWRGFYDLTPSTVSIEHNLIYDNYLAIELVSSPLAHAYYNCIYDNAYGVYVDSDLNNVNETFDARYNWWGSSTGPTNPSNPGGVGQEAGDYVLFAPWLEEAGFTYNPANPVVGQPVTFDAAMVYKGCTALKTIVSYMWNFADGNTTTVAAPTIVHKFAAIGSYNVTLTVTYDDLSTYKRWAVVNVLKQPYFKVVPTTINAKLLNSTVVVNITVNDVSAVHRLIAVQARLSFNPTLVQIVNVTEGPFWKSFVQPGSLGTFFFSNEYASNVIVGSIIMPNGTGSWNPPFPQGSGVIASITFKVIHQHRGLETPLLKFNMTLTDNDLFGDDGVTIPTAVQKGEFKIWPTHIADFNYDGKVDLKDYFRVAKAFGSDIGPPPHPRWDAVCDINGDGKVDLKDIFVVAKAYGWVQDPDP